jgi:hypothetical protein
MKKALTKTKKMTVPHPKTKIANPMLPLPVTKMNFPMMKQIIVSCLESTIMSNGAPKAARLGRQNLENQYRVNGGRPILNWEARDAHEKGRQALISKQRKRSITLERVLGQNTKLSQVPYRKLACTLLLIISLILLL